MINILVTGAHGQLATAIKNNIKNCAGTHYLFADRMLFDITNLAQCEFYLKTHHISYIVNCAAYTNVDKAEIELELAANINSIGPLNLAKLAKKYDVKLIHISTDYVHAGDNSTPYLETDATKPVNNYGRTKLSGENNIIATFTNYIIIRTGWLYYYTGKNFFNTILNLIKTNDQLNIVADQTGSPTYCGDLANFIVHIINQSTSQKTNYFNNIYNFANLADTTWYKFACAIKEAVPELAKHTCQIKPITTKEYPTLALRPRYSVLNKSKAITTFNYHIPSWQNGLARCVKEGLSVTE